MVAFRNLGELLLAADFLQDKVEAQRLELFGAGFACFYIPTSFLIIIVHDF